MRIKQLELIGFKSFKDRTILAFPAGITAIVGPNGCGKSNIVDALRWVLGEQGPRQLRGQEMSDVVFAGTDGEAPLGMAEVTLLLENNAAELPIGGNGPNGNGGPFENWTEMMVSRRYFRSGESEYFLNKVPCRLRDIVEFFLGTGAGTKAYSIIEQGRVDQLVNAKPEEIRVFVEEAAGVSLYRSRRIVAERKLERTQDNLSRVADLLHEMERQLGSLRRQAKKAEQYRTLQEELKTVDLTLLCKAYHDLSRELTDLGARREEVVHQEEHLFREEQRLQAERTQAAETLAQEEAALRACEERHLTLESALRHGEQRKQFVLQQEQDAAARASAAQVEVTGLAEKQGQLHGEMTQLSTDLAESQDLLLQEETALQAHEQDSARLQQILAQHEAEAEELKTEIVDCLTQETQLQNSLAHAQRRAAEVEQRLSILMREADQVARVLGETEHALVSAQDHATHLRDQLLVGQRQHREKTDALREVANAGERLDAELTTALAKQAELRTRLTTLEEMEQGYERYPQGVQSIMARAESPTGTLGVVAHMVEVPQRYERAVAAVLRDKLEYIVVSNIEDGLAAVEYLRNAQAGHGSFIPLYPRSQNGSTPEYSYPPATTDLPFVAASAEPQEIVPLVELLTIDPRCREVIGTLLADTFLVPDLQTGLQLWRQNGASRTFVTLQGEVISAHGVVSGGSEGFVEEGLLERRREIRDLRQQVEQQEALVTTLVRRRQELKHTHQELKDELARLEAEGRTLGQQSETVQREAGKLEGEHRRLLDKKEGIAYERQTLETDRQSLQQEIDGLDTRRATVSAQRQEREAGLAARQDEMVQVKVDLEQRRALTDGLRVRIAERRERQEGTRGHITRLRDQHRELTDRLTACQTEMQAARSEGERLRATLAELAELLIQQAADLASTTQEQTWRQESCARLQSQCRGYAEQLEQKRETRTQLQEEKTRFEVSIAEKRVSCEHLDATVRERYGVAIAEVLAQYVESPLETAAGEARRQELRDKLTRLGEVNPGATAELAEVEERYAFFQSQAADLRRSIDDLQHTISKLNRESRERFRETLAQVDTQFRHVYARLVEGGRAQVTLTNEADLTESGVEISVQPPGKRLRSLQLLSGGEKALAALSFIVALFLIRPSPFCVLDEVDAPLDDANVDRFNQLMKEVSATTQVVLITHNKRTMESAATLYGVTMQEPGVSTVVSVRVT